MDLALDDQATAKLRAEMRTRTSAETRAEQRP
jgi:hypothetical protein